MKDQVGKPQDRASNVRSPLEPDKLVKAIFQIPKDDAHRVAHSKPTKKRKKK